MELTIEQIQENRIKRLKEARKNANLSLTNAAKTIGVNRSTLVRWESGLITGLKLPHLKKLAELYNVSEQWLFGYDVPMRKETEEELDYKKKILDLINRASPEDLKKIEGVLNVFMDKFKEGSSK